MQLRSFTLIELLIVIAIISFISIFIIVVPSKTKSKLSIDELKEITYPNGSFYLLKNNEAVLIKDRNKTVSISLTLPKVLEYKDGQFLKKEFGEEVVFEYHQKNGLGDFFILVAEEGIYVFKPLFIKKFDTLKSAKEYYLLNNHQPLKDNYY